GSEETRCYNRCKSIVPVRRVGRWKRCRRRSNCLSALLLRRRLPAKILRRGLTNETSDACGGCAAGSGYYTARHRRQVQDHLRKGPGRRGAGELRGCLRSLQAGLRPEAEGFALQGVV